MTSPSLSTTLTPTGPRAFARPLPPARAASRRPPATRGPGDAAESDLFATRLQAGRELRVAASFCETQDEAVWLWRRLRALTGLTEEQVLLLKPVDATPRRFAQWQPTWDALRPALRRAGPSARRAWLPASALAGLLLGLAAGVQAGLPVLATLGLIALATGVIWGAALEWMPHTPRAAPQRRFDRALRQRLAHGQFAVVVTDVREAATANAAIEAMRSAGVYWCAETPRKAA